MILIADDPEQGWNSFKSLYLGSLLFYTNPIFSATDAANPSNLRLVDPKG